METQASHKKQEGGNINSNEPHDTVNNFTIPYLKQNQEPIYYWNMSLKNQDVNHNIDNTPT